MRLTDAERAENKEALARMNLAQRLDHIFEYYKFPLVLMLIAVVALGSILYYRITYKNTLLCVAYANIAVHDVSPHEPGSSTSCPHIPFSRWCFRSVAIIFR